MLFRSSTPESSVPFYELIPVATVGASVATNVSKAYNNSIVGGTHEKYGVNRYEVSVPAYFNYAPIVVAYPSQSYNPYAAAAFSSAQFGGLAISLDQGLVIDATGEAISSPPQPPLIDMTANAPKTAQGNVKSVAHYMPAMMNHLKRSEERRVGKEC